MNPLSRGEPSNQIRQIEAKKRSNYTKVALAAVVGLVAIGIIGAIAATHSGALSHLVTGHTKAASATELVKFLGVAGGAVTVAGMAGIAICSVAAKSKRLNAQIDLDKRIDEIKEAVAKYKQDPNNKAASRTTLGSGRKDPFIHGRAVKAIWEPLTHAEQKDLWNALEPSDRKESQSSMARIKHVKNELGHFVQTETPGHQPFMKDENLSAEENEQAHLHARSAARSRDIEKELSAKPLDAEKDIWGLFDQIKGLEQD